MSELWRILLVEDDDNLNQSIVNSLRKDGYFVQGVRSGAEAIRIVWSEEYDVVIGDLKMPGADGFEMLQWLRAYRPKTRMIMVAPFGSAATRTQALEAGVVSYLEKPLDLHLLKEELRRLLQQTGFSASLDSFDLLDVIQIITMSRKSIALLVNTGLEERGVLRFQGGELIWAEYGMLRGEEAFFALAAHKNGTVTHQLWNEQIVPNVKQPLSRLIFQALQYRTKYAATSSMQQTTGEQQALAHVTPSSSPAVWSEGARSLSPITDDDDSPFTVLEEEQHDTFNKKAGHELEDTSMVLPAGKGSRGVPLAGTLGNGGNGRGGNGNEGSKEWWQQSGKVPTINNNSQNASSSMVGVPLAGTLGEGGTARTLGGGNAGTMASGQPAANGTNIVPSTVRKTLASQRSDLPSWLTDQPTKSDMPTLRPSSLTGTAQVPAAPGSHGPASVAKPSPAEWQPTQPQAKTTEQLPRKQTTGDQKGVSKGSNPAIQHPSSPEWLPPEKTKSPYGSLQSISTPHKTGDVLSPREKEESDPLALSNTGKVGSQRSSKRNYVALVTALQTLGYSIAGFIAAAVVGLDGQPIAQVAIDDLDISPMCGYFSTILQGVLLSLGQEDWGKHEDTVITSAERHILLRLIGSDKEAFQVLITTRESDPVESLEVMANVEGTLGAALR